MERSPEERKKLLSKWRDLVFTARYRNARILDSKDRKRVDRGTGEVIYGTEMIFRNFTYVPKSRREAEILLDSPGIHLQGAPIQPKQEEQIVGVVTAPHPPNVFSEKQ